MVRPRTVSEWGPNAQGVRSRPDRSVSLRDVREQPVQTMGLGQGGAPGKFGGGYGVHTRISELDGEYRVRLFIDGEYQAGADYFTDDVAEAHETAKAMEEDAHLSDKDSDVARDEARDFVEDAIMRPDLDEVEVPEDLVADDARLPVEEMRGLTADEAFQQHHATSGAGAMGGMNAARAIEGQQEMPWGPRQEALDVHIPEARRILEEAKRRAEEAEAQPRPSGRPVVEGPPIPPPLSQMAGPDWEAIEEGDYGAGNWWDTVPGMDDLGDALPDPDEPLNPELRSMDSQMLADMMVAQPEQGYFGGLGDAVQGLTNRVAGMSGQERAALIAALVAAGLITVGSGGTLAPAGAALLGGAGLTALNQ